jgi:GNAT superfamily N-acetyltransferase
MKIEVYNGNNIREGSMKALSNRLFQNGWMLGEIYRDLRDGFNNDYDCGVVKSVLIAILEGVPVASAIVTTEESEFQVFVRKRHRRKGIGSALYARAMEIEKRTKPLIMWADHSWGAQLFYDSNANKEWSIIEQDHDDYETIEVELKERLTV